MKSKIQILIFIIVSGTININAQKSSRKFSGDKSKEIVCISPSDLGFIITHDKNNNVKWIIAKPKTKQFFSSLEKEEVIKYQKHLNKNGYKVNTIGYIDKKTISAHKKYERKKRREKRKAKRKTP